jgi:hypothetical protein
LGGSSGMPVPSATRVMASKPAITAAASIMASRPRPASTAARVWPISPAVPVIVASTKASSSFSWPTPLPPLPSTMPSRP